LLLEEKSHAMISLDEAVEALIGHRYAGRDEFETAWRRLCRMVIDGLVHPRGRHADGTTFAVDTDQFHDMANRYFRYAACIRQLVLEPPTEAPPGAVGWGDKFRFVKIEGPGSYKVRDTHGVTRPDCNLIFPKDEVASTKLDAKPQARKKCLPPSRDPEIIKFMRDSGIKSCDKAIKAAEKHFQSAIGRARGRKLWEEAGLLRLRGCRS
jgi:hypothetical protein